MNKNKPNNYIQELKQFELGGFLLLKMETKMVSLILFGLLFLYLCWFLVRRFSYWSRQNIPFVPLKFPYIYGNISKGTHPALQFADFYKIHRKENYPLIGIYTMFLKPVVLVMDLPLMRQILIGDFNHFQDRGMFYNERNDPLSAILGTLDYDKWKPIRSNLTPAFTSAKIRAMFPIVKKVGDELVDGLMKIVEIENQVEIRDLFGRFTADVIGSVAIGIKFQCLNTKSRLQEMVQKAMKPHLKFPWNVLTSTCPKLARFLGMRKHAKEISDFFVDIIKETIEHRTENNERRNDFMQLLIDANLTTNQIAALSFDFLSAGYADATSTLSYCLYELSMNEEIQEKARHEIESVLEENDGELAHEVLDQMGYCKLIINETLRMHPVGGNITRIATKAYEVPNTNFTIPKGMRVYIPTFAIHHDEEFYPNPEEFIPERFSEGGNIPAGAFIPFGDGQRKCIGSNFAKILISTALVSLLKNFKFSTCDRTQIPIKYSSTKNTLIPEDGVWLNVQRI